MIVQTTRFVAFIAGALAGLYVAQVADWTQQIGYSEYYVLFIFIVLGGSIGFVLGGIIGRELSIQFTRFEERLHDVSMIDLILSAAGILGGLLVALAAAYPLRSLEPQAIAIVATVALYVVGAWIGMRVALVKRADAAVAFPNLAGTGARGQDRPRYLDTSAIIDGRFAELRRAGYFDGRLQVPRFVLAELQGLADSADDVRRARGRRGLDLLASLREGDGRTDVIEVDYPSIPEVDSKLIRLAADSGGIIVTVDYNLASTARVTGVEVINVNELALALRPTYLPGETLRLRLLRDGKEPEQGVGYLEDGTMVVVQGGREHVGSEVETEVTSVLQTSAGRMVFAKMGQVVQ